MPLGTAKLKWLAILLAPGLLVVAVAIYFAWSRGGQPPPLPVPNGYDDLARAAAGITGQFPDLDAATINELRAFVQQNAAAIELARVGLTRECRMPLDYSMTFMEYGDYRIDKETAQLPRKLTRLFIAAGRVKQIDGDAAGAAEAYLDTVRMGRQMTRGGLIVDALVGYAVEGMGLKRLHEVTEQLSAADRRLVLEELARLDQSRAPVDDVIATEGDFFDQTASWKMRFEKTMAGHLFEPAIEATRQAHHRAEVMLRLFLLHLAIEDYRAERGRLPAKLDELVPQYVDRLPADAFGSGPLRYQLQGDGYLLYSVGPDGDDDGGKPFRWAAGPGRYDGDLSIETLLDPPSSEEASKD